MKKIKSSVVAMLSAVTLLFSSCLGDSEYTPTIGCTGVPYGLGASVMLDNGVIANLSGFSSTDLMNVNRVFVYGQLTGESANLEQIQAGQEIDLIPQVAVELDELETITNTGETVENAFADYNLTTINNLGWFTMNNVFNALNGYMNFTLVGDCYSRNNSGSGTSSSNSNTLVTPNYYIYVGRVDAQAKIVDLYIGFDNRESECVEENGDPKTGYSLNTNISFYLSFDTTSLYSQLDSKGISDDESVTFNIYTVEKADDGTIETEKVSSSWDFTNIQKLLLKRTYRSY